jgi:hypothetical protein
MSKKRIMAGIPEVAKPKKLSQVKDRDEKRWMIEDASRTLTRSIEIEREIEDMKTRDPELFAAAQAFLDQELSDIKKAKKI